MEYLKRAFTAIGLHGFKTTNFPDKVFDYELECPHDRQYILRMMIREPHGEFKIPTELEWCEDLIVKCDAKQKEHNLNHSFCYITVRHGLLDSETDDEWHTDGYSEMITHLPEQNYIVTSNSPTEYIGLPIAFPEDFDAKKHNLVTYINSEVERKQPKVLKAQSNKVYVFDPYVIHRRPVGIEGKMRTFVRVTFVPVEIMDDNCTPNPLLAIRRYNRTADTVRGKLIEYKRTLKRRIKI